MGGVEWIDLTKIADRFGHGIERSGCLKFPVISWRAEEILAFEEGLLPVELPRIVSSSLSFSGFAMGRIAKGAVT